MKPRGLTIKDKNGVIKVDSEKLKDKNYTMEIPNEKYYIDFAKIKAGFLNKTGETLEQKDLAEMIGVSKQTISNWKNVASPPIIPKLKAISELCGLNINQFISKK